MDKPDGIYGAEGDSWKYEIKNGVPVAAIRADGKRVAVSANNDDPAYGAILRQLVTGIIKPIGGESKPKSIDRSMISEKVDGPLMSRLANERAKSDTLMADEAAEAEEAGPSRSAPKTQSVTIRYIGGGEKKITPRDPEWAAFKDLVQSTPAAPSTPREAMSSAIDRAMLEVDDPEATKMSRLAQMRAKSDTLMADEAEEGT